MKIKTRAAIAFFTLAILLLFASRVSAQATVASFSLLPKAQFFSSTGVPLAAGCIDFFATGTTNRQAIYADSSGLFQLANPLTLDAGGYAEVWGTNVGYDIQANTGVANTSCATNEGSLVWKITNHNPFAVVNFGSNFIVASGTSDPSGSAGMLAYRTDLPCFRGFTTFWDCFVRLTDVQTLTNKTLTNPTITNPVVTMGSFTTPSINGVSVANTPGTYISLSNSVTGTTVNRLTKIVGGLAQVAATTDINGIEGITVQCVTSCGQPGTSVVQQSGLVSCIFDNATTANDYVTISILTGGSCHDSGSTYPLSGQAIGRILTTNANPGFTNAYQIILFSPEIIAGQVGAATGCTAIGPVTIVNLNTIQTLLSCSIAANSLSGGSLLNVDVTGVESTASAGTITLTYNIGGGTVCQSVSGAAGVANNQPWNAYGKFSVLTAGAAGTANWSCGYSSSAAGGGLIGNNGVVGAPTIAINTTVSNTLLIQVQMSVANAGNSVTGQLLKAVIF